MSLINVVGFFVFLFFIFIEKGWVTNGFCKFYAYSALISWPSNIAARVYLSRAGDLWILFKAVFNAGLEKREKNKVVDRFSINLRRGHFIVYSKLYNTLMLMHLHIIHIIHIIHIYTMYNIYADYYNRLGFLDDPHMRHSASVPVQMWGWQPWVYPTKCLLCEVVLYLL